MAPAPRPTARYRAGLAIVAALALAACEGTVASEPEEALGAASGGSVGRDAGQTSVVTLALRGRRPLPAPPGPAAEASGRRSWPDRRGPVVRRRHDGQSRERRHRARHAGPEGAGGSGPGATGTAPRPPHWTSSMLPVWTWSPWPTTTPPTTGTSVCRTRCAPHARPRSPSSESGRTGGPRSRPTGRRSAAPTSPSSPPTARRARAAAATGRPQPRTPGIAAARTARPRALLAAVRAASRRDDVVVVYLHWGREYRSCPTALQRRTAEALAQAGADVVVGSHAHVLLGTGWSGETYVGYGLGNFVWYHNREPDTGVLQAADRGRARGVRRLGAGADPAVGSPAPAGRPRPRAGGGRLAPVARLRRPRPATAWRRVTAPASRCGRSGRRCAARMSASHRAGCPVALKDLRHLRMSHIGFDGRRHLGEMVVAARYARDVVRVFERLYDARWPIRRMRLVDAYGGADATVHGGRQHLGVQLPPRGRQHQLVGARLRRRHRHQPGGEPVPDRRLDRAPGRAPFAARRPLGGRASHGQASSAPTTSWSGRSPPSAGSGAALGGARLPALRGARALSRLASAMTSEPSRPPGQGTPTTR